MNTAAIPARPMSCTVVSAASDSSMAAAKAMRKAMLSYFPATSRASRMPMKMTAVASSSSTREPSHRPVGRDRRSAVLLLYSSESNAWSPYLTSTPMRR